MISFLFCRLETNYRRCSKCVPCIWLHSLHRRAIACRTLADMQGLCLIWSNAVNIRSIRSCLMLTGLMYTAKTLFLVNIFFLNYGQNNLFIMKSILKGGNGWDFGHFGQKSLFHFIELMWCTYYYLWFSEVSDLYHCCAVIYQAICKFMCHLNTL